MAKSALNIVKYFSRLTKMLTWDTGTVIDFDTLVIGDLLYTNVQ